MSVFNRRLSRHMARFAAHRMAVLNCFGKFEEFFRVLLSDEPDLSTLRAIQITVDNCERAADAELSHLLDPPHHVPAAQICTRLLPLTCALDGIAKHCRKTVYGVMAEAPELPVCLRAELSEILALTKKQLSLLGHACDRMLYEPKTLDRDRKLLADIRAEADKLESLRLALHGRIYASQLPPIEKRCLRDLLDDLCRPAHTVGEITDQIRIMLLGLRR